MTIADFDKMPREALKEQLMKCCGSAVWADKVLSRLPVEDMIDLFEVAEEAWYSCSEQDWREAFAHHPQIGNTASLKKEAANTAEWAGKEQSGMQHAGDDLKSELANLNEAYFKKFGYIYIINATGKSAEEMLNALQQRINNAPDAEIKIAAAEQMSITRIRLEKLLAS